MPLNPQFEAILPMLRAVPKLSQIPLAMLRSMPTPPNPSPTSVAEVTNRMIPGPAGEIPVRIYRARSDAKLPLLLFMHGGGFVAGGLDSHDEMARVLTKETGCVTVSVDYRLAPENPAPAAAEDCYAALKWAVADAAVLNVDATQVAVAGDSAGGNLAAVMALMARDKGGPRLKGAVAIYPVTDLANPLPPPLGGEYLLVTPEESAFFHRSYVPDSSHIKDPYVSPIYADLHGLPPMLVMTAEYDPLCRQGEAFVAKLEAAGVDTTHIRYNGAIHGFASFPVPMGREALKEAAQWLKACFAH
ncbi:MAG TPA: alpha/beta hydrolase [Rhizomicrobium sp.]|nr:alpha/beta hydrolase [Rhizomicrobium sp.]